MIPYRLKRANILAEWLAADLGSDRLFAACWRRYRQYLAAGAIDYPSSDREALDWLEDLAAELVNSAGSPFYIYG